MTSENLKAILSRKEGLKLEFKQNYLLEGQGQERMKAEIAKDLLSLANTLSSNVNESAYLIVGAADELKSDGTRESFSVVKGSYSSNQFLEIVNARCAPPIQNLTYEEVEYDGSIYGVFELPASPEIHYCTQDLRTPSGKIWPKNSVFIRRGDQIGLATPNEILNLAARKQQINRAAKPQKQIKTNPLRNVRAVSIHTPLDFKATIGAHCISHHILFKAANAEVEREVRWIIKSIFQNLQYIDNYELDMVMSYLDDIEEPLAALSRLDIELFCVTAPERYKIEQSNESVMLNVAHYYFVPKDSFFAVTEPSNALVHRFSDTCRAALLDFMTVIRTDKEIRLWQGFADVIISEKDKVSLCNQCCADDLAALREAISENST